MKKSFSIVLLLLLSFSGFTQQIWTLEKCIDYALTNNIQVKQQQLLVDGTKTEVLQSKLSLLPSLNAYASHGYNFGKTVDRYTNQFATKSVQSDNFYLSSQLTLFSGFQKINNMKKSKVDQESVKYDFNEYMDNISVNIATAYVQILYFKELAKTAEAQVNTTDLQVDRLKKLVAAGSIAQGDLYNLQAQRAAEQVQLIDARNNLEIAYLTLAQMLDLPSADGFEIEVPNLEIGLNPVITLNTDQVYEFALGARPNIKSAQLKVTSSELNLASAKGAMYPSISMGASIGTGYSGAAQLVDSVIFRGISPTALGVSKDVNGVNNGLIYAYAYDYRYKNKTFGSQFSDNINRSLNFNLSLPLFNGYSTHSNISRAKISLDNAKLSLENNKLQLRKTIQQAYADARGALNKYQAALLSVDATRESFRYSEEKFNVNMINSVQYNEAKKVFEKAQSDLLNAKFEFIFKTTVLDFYMGKPITLKRS
jgi:outer membrane protein